ncbi:uncharacterized protein LOC111634082 [Centruroides sculpturatus]|uniref:uncharacterized protein LOC111634082 n=1 Tax=Centruroides sculpturatus TaxID=218467 RepID=UPI000C6D7E19|nr:uncharacterized protein LOC111634082 [Centruroides sculpturatus]
MKVYLIAAFSFLAVFGVVQSFTPEEFEDAVCSIPEKYLLRFLNCTVSRAPEIFQKKTDNLYECVDRFYEVDGKLDAILTVVCGNTVHAQKDIEECLQEKGKDLVDLDLQDQSAMKQAAKYCVIHA